MSAEGQIYAQWLQTAPIGLLTPIERKKRADNEQWILDHPEEHAVLEAYIGQRVRLIRDRQTYSDVRLTRGMQFTIIAHGRECLYGRAEALVYALAPKWVEICSQRDLQRARAPTR